MVNVIDMCDVMHEKFLNVAQEYRQTHNLPIPDYAGRSLADYLNDDDEDEEEDDEEEGEEEEEDGGAGAGAGGEGEDDDDGEE